MENVLKKIIVNVRKTFMEITVKIKNALLNVKTENAIIKMANVNAWQILVEKIAV
jgi:hypothetical protein